MTKSEVNYVKIIKHHLEYKIVFKHTTVLDIQQKITKHTIRQKHMIRTLNIAGQSKFSLHHDSHD